MWLCVNTATGFFMDLEDSTFTGTTVVQSFLPRICLKKMITPYRIKMAEESTYFIPLSRYPFSYIKFCEKNEIGVSKGVRLIVAFYDKSYYPRA